MLDIPKSVYMKSFQFTMETASGSLADLKIQLKAYDTNYRTVDYYIEARKFRTYPWLDDGAKTTIPLPAFRNYVWCAR